MLLYIVVQNIRIDFVNKRWKIVCTTRTEIYEFCLTYPDFLLFFPAHLSRTRISYHFSAHQSQGRRQKEVLVESPLPGDFLLEVLCLPSEVCLWERPWREKQRLEPPKKICRCFCFRVHLQCIGQVYAAEVNGEVSTQRETQRLQRLLVNLQYCKLLMCSKRHFRDIYLQK